MVSKKLLQTAIASLTGVATLGLSSLVFAGSEFSPAPAPIVPAVDNGNTGFYAGVRAGYADNHWNREVERLPFKPFVDVKHTGFAGGVNVGYAFNRFIAVEGGYMYLPNAKLTAKGVPSSLFNVRAQNYAFDLSAKLTLPVPGIENVGVYGKMGVGFLNSKITERFDGVQEDPSFKADATKLTYGAGVYWDVASNIRLDAGWQRWQGGRTTRREGFDLVTVNQPSMDTFTVGASYFFNGVEDLFNS